MNYSSPVLMICMDQCFCCLLSKVLSCETHVVDVKEWCFYYIGYMFLHVLPWPKMTPRLRAESLLIISVLPMMRLLRCGGSLKQDPITKITVLSSLIIIDHQKCRFLLFLLPSSLSSFVTLSSCSIWPPLHFLFFSRMLCPQPYLLPIHCMIFSTSLISDGWLVNDVFGEYIRHIFNINLVHFQPGLNQDCYNIDTGSYQIVLRYIGHQLFLRCLISDIVQSILHWLVWSHTSIPVCCSNGVIVDKLILQWSIDVNVWMIIV